MKKIYIAIQTEEKGKFYAFAEIIRTGENLKFLFDRYAHKAKIFHICESRRQAEELVFRWNATYKANGTYLFDTF